MNLPFQVSGSSREKRISVPMTPVTRQCAARISPLVAAGTATASPILMSGSVRLVSPAHSRCGAGVCADKMSDNAAPQRIAATHRLVIFMLRPFEEVEDSGR